MKLTADILPISVNGRLADYLTGHREFILSEWFERVRRDTEIPTDTLSVAAIKNHLPHLFNDMIETFRRYGSYAVAKQTVTDAGAHASIRRRQGFLIREVLRELMHLRSGLVYHLCRFEESNPDIGSAARFFTATTVHRILDEMGMDATEQFQMEDGKTR